jgi:hypothetical protein
MTPTIIKSGYGLIHKKTNKLVGFEVRSNAGADCCGENTYELSLYADNVWIVESKMNASYVRVTSTPWYNAEYETPVMNIGKPEEFDVVKIEMTVSVETPDYIPTWEEYMNLKYNRPGKKHYNPKHYEYHVGEYRKGNRYAPISQYEIVQLIKEIEKENTRPRKV